MTQPSQNAFDLLKSGVSKLSQSQNVPTGKRRRSSADQQGKYTVCPVCGGSYPTAFIESHVSDCIVRSSQKPTQSKSPAAPRPPTSAAPSTANGHNRNAEAQTAAAGTSKTPPASINQCKRRSTSSTLLAKQESVVDADGTAKPNAFARLTAAQAAAQAAKVPHEAHLFLEACNDGSWVCHWWNEGAACPKEGLQTAWSGTANANLPKDATSSSSNGDTDLPHGKTKLRLHLATNLPSGFGAAVDWSNQLLPSNCKIQQPQQQLECSAPSQGPEYASQGSGTAAVNATTTATAGGGARWRGGASVPISALQKCIRRGLAASATRIALSLLKDPDTVSNLLRRLSIICLEDGLLHPQLPLVVWTMMAVGQGYVIGGSLANAVLSITFQMASVGHRDFLPNADEVRGPAAAIYQAPRTWQAVDAMLPPASPENLLVKCILIRGAYGGMHGDKDMLFRFAGLWLKRFSGVTLLPPQLPQQQTAAAAALQPQQQLTEHSNSAAATELHQDDATVPDTYIRGLPARKGPACFETAPAANSPWLAFLREAYEGLSQPNTPEAAAATCQVMQLGPLQRNDIPAAAIDFHVSQAQTTYLLQQPAVQAAIKAVTSSSSEAAAQYSGAKGAEQLVKDTMWLFRGSYNRKAWLQECYVTPEEREKIQQGSGYAQQTLAMELDALQRHKARVHAQRQQLMPVWKAMAALADAWSKDLIKKKLY